MKRLEQHSVAASDAFVATADTQRANEFQTPPEASQFGSTLTLIGKALLGIAGAYVLRALAGSATLPRLLLGIAGAVYAVGWIVAAARTSRRFAGGLYAATSVLILAPMLWEMSLRFEAMPPMIAAVVLTAYVLAVVIAARSRCDSPAFTVAFAGSAVTALALCIGTRQMLLFVTLLVAMVLLGEIVRSRGKAMPVHPVVLLAADVSVLALLSIYRAPADTRAEYFALSPVAVLGAPFLLFVIQAAAAGFHVCARRQMIAVLEAMQMMVSFGLVTLGVFWMAPQLSGDAVGSLCVVFSAGCYWVAFDPLRGAAHPRNFRLLATWALALAGSGLYLLLPVSWAAVALATAAAAAMFTARRRQSTVLEIHATVYVVAAAFVSGLHTYVWHALIADTPARPTWNILAVSALAILAYGACPEQQSESGERKLLNFIAAFLAACAGCALLTQALLALAASIVIPDVFHVALVRTLAICGLALALAIGGARLHRSAMNRVAYTLLGFVVLKLVFEDLRHGHLGFLAASIGIVAITLIAVPRVASRT